jgi:hypothetical protein
MPRLPRHWRSWCRRPRCSGRGRGRRCCRRADRRGCRSALGEEGRDHRMAVEISGVILCPSDDLITAARLDYPRTGPVDGYAFEVNGWVVSKAPVAEVGFVHEQSVVACCELTVSRPDVARMYGSSSSPVGFWKAIGTVGLPPAFTIRVRVVFQDGRRALIAQICGKQQLTSAFSPPCSQSWYPSRPIGQHQADEGACRVHPGVSAVDRESDVCRFRVSAAVRRHQAYFCGGDIDERKRLDG